jgi:hypothetical protein
VVFSRVVACFFILHRKLSQKDAMKMGKIESLSGADRIFDRTLIILI